MIDALRLYRLYAGVSVRGQMQYRASFVMETIGQFGIVGVEFIGILVLFSRFDTLEGWTLPQVAFLYGLVHLGFSFAGHLQPGFRQLRAHGQVGRLRPAAAQAALDRPAAHGQGARAAGAWAGSCWRSG